GPLKEEAPTDQNRLAASLVADATADEPEQEQDPYEGKNPAAVELGRQGGLKGGRARAEKLTPEQAERDSAQGREKRAGDHVPSCSPPCRARRESRAAAASAGRRPGRTGLQTPPCCSRSGEWSSRSRSGGQGEDCRYRR